MNKLVLLSEVRKEKTNNKNMLLEVNEVKREKEDSTESYTIFKEKFDSFQNKECYSDLKDKKINYTKYEKKLNKIMKRIFSFSNKVPLIELINSIYKDELSTNTRIQYIKNKDININNQIINSNYNVKILAEDDYRKFEYEIQFKTRDYENIAIIITKVDFTNEYRNIVSFNMKKKEYKDSNEVNLERDSKDNCNKYIIMLNSNIQVPDVYEFKGSFENKNIDYKINIMKSWKYDFKQLFEKNMYILFPVKVLDLKKRLISISQDVISKDLIKDEIIRFFREMNRYLNKVKDKNLITDEDINEFNLIAIDLLNHFIKEENNIFVDIKGDIKATLKDIVV